MRSSVGGALLAVILCAVSTGCASGVYGAAVTAQNPAAGTSVVTTIGPSQLRGWQPGFDSKLKLAKVARFRRKAVLVEPTQVVSGLGAKTLLVGHPKLHSTYRFQCWIKASRDLPGPLLIQLQALASNARTWKKVAAVSEPLGGHWRRYSVSGKLKLSGAIALRAVVFVKSSVTLESRLALDDVSVKRISPAGTGES
jgi:hypothetical protein